MSSASRGEAARVSGGLICIASLIAIGSLAAGQPVTGGGGGRVGQKPFKVPQWGENKQGNSKEAGSRQEDARSALGRDSEGLSKDQSKSLSLPTLEGGGQPSIRFVNPHEGSDVNVAPFLLRMETDGFRVPEDGEIRLTMKYQGRGSQVRVLQSLEFMCWNVLNAPLQVEAQLISTKDENIGAPATVNLNTRINSFFTVSSPSDGDLFFASRPIPVTFLLSGFGDWADLPVTGNVCLQMTCMGANTAEVRVCSQGDDGRGLEVEGGKYKMNLPAKPGNCTLVVSVEDANQDPVAREERRNFWVADEQVECPHESGVACLYGWCSETSIHGQEKCRCADGFVGAGCAVKGDAHEGGVLAKGRSNISKKYINLVKDALLDTLYAKDRPGESNVVARSMVGRKGLDDLEGFVWDILDRGVPGDFMETGVWQGGSCILMRAVLEASGDAERKVWVVDSFEGCPVPNEEEYPVDSGDKHHTFQNLAVPLAKVRSNFADFGLLDDRVEFVKGWFEDSMQSPRIGSINSIALLRLDGDLYQSTYEVLRGIYFKVSIGGIVIVDDWRLDGMQARSAVIDFHRECGLTETIHVAADGLAWWQKEFEGFC